MFTCFKCEKVLQSVTGKFEDFHPLDGLHFMAYGHYGTTVFDPMDGSTMNIIICDDCLNKSKHKHIRKPKN